MVAALARSRLSRIETRRKFVRHDLHPVAPVFKKLFCICLFARRSRKNQQKEKNSHCRRHRWILLLFDDHRSEELLSVTYTRQDESQMFVEKEKAICVASKERTRGRQTLMSTSGFVLGSQRSSPSHYTRDYQLTQHDSAGLPDADECLYAFSADQYLTK